MIDSGIDLNNILKKYSSEFLFIGDSGVRYKYNDVIKLSQSKVFLVAPKRLFFCVIGNDVDGLAGYLSIIAAGHCVLVLPKDIKKDVLLALVQAYRPSFVWLPTIILSDLNSDKVEIEIGAYSLLSFNSNFVNLNESLSLLLSTSGSTGSPKFVRLSKENILSNAKAIAEYLNLDQNDLPITTLPPSYTYGLSIIHSHILVGATIAVTEKTFFDREFWDFFRNVKATSFGGVPYHYEMLKKLRFTKMKLPSLSKLTQAGGRMEPELSREFATFARDRGIEYYTMYGQAEATSRMSYLSPERAITKAGSIGAAIPGGRFWLEDENGQVIQDADVAGELVYSGPNVSMGYASSFEDLAKGDERGGILRTGDLSKRDQDGDYYIVGRLKRFIKLFGHRTNLLDVETFLLSEGYVTACSGQDDLLQIYVSNHEKAEGKKIKQMVCNHLKVALQAVVVYAISEFPRNDSGKIQYGELKPALGEKIA
jgi:long-chain acyl-CoA synthetase